MVGFAIIGPAPHPDRSDAPPGNRHWEIAGSMDGAGGHMPEEECMPTKYTLTTM